jgi:hypothetical protein
MDDMRVLFAVVVIFAIFAVDIAFNGGALMNWIAAQVGWN